MLPSETPATAPRDGTVAYDALCARCRYDLRGLPTTGACPECGTRVLASLPGGPLRASSPRFLRAAHHGSGLAEASLVGWLVFLATALAPLRYGPGGGSTATALTGAVLVCSVPGLVGWWLLTSPLGGHRVGEPNTRPLIRVLLLIAIAAETSIFAGAMLSWWQAGGTTSRASQGAGWLMGIAVVVRLAVVPLLYWSRWSTSAPSPIGCPIALFHAGSIS